MAKTKRVSYAGIPAKNRAQVAKLLHLQAADVDFTGKAPKTPQEAWAALNEHWAKQREEEQAKKDKAAKDRAERVRELALKALESALRRFSMCRDLAEAIEDSNGYQTYLPHEEMAGFVLLGIQKAGEELEQALCNLGLIPEDNCGLFVGDELKSEGVKFEPEVEEEEEQEAANV